KATEAASRLPEKRQTTRVIIDSLVVRSRSGSYNLNCYGEVPQDRCSRARRARPRQLARAGADDPDTPAGLRQDARDDADAEEKGQAARAEESPGQKEACKKALNGHATTGLTSPPYVAVASPAPDPPAAGVCRRRRRGGCRRPPAVADQAGRRQRHPRQAARRLAQ